MNKTAKLPETPEEIIKEAQPLYDSYNWGSLPAAGHNRLNVLKMKYKQLTGQDMPLVYSCPA